MPCFRSLIRLLGRNERLALVISFGCLSGRIPCSCCFIRLFGRTHEPCVPTCLQRFPCKGKWSAGEIWAYNQQTSWRFRRFSSLYVPYSQYAYSKPHYGFTVYSLFMLCIPNPHMVNRMAVSLFIGQGWRATSTLSPSDEQEVNAKGVAFSSDKRFFIA